MPRIAHSLRGLLVPDPAWTHTLVTSDPTEGGPRPGEGSPAAPTSLRVVGTGVQTEDVDVKVVRSGHPGRQSGPGLVVKLASDTDYRTWSPPWAQMFSSGIKTYDTTTETSPNAAALQPQGIRLPGTTTFGLAHNGRFHRYNWALDTWTDVQVTPGTNSGLRACDITAIGDRLIYAASYGTGTKRVNLWYSDDLGATWAVYAEQVTGWDTPSSLDDMSIEYHQQTGTIALFLDRDQYASADLGLTFVKVSNLGSYDSKPCVLSDGTILQAAIYNAGTLSGKWVVRRVGSPFDSMESSNSGSGEQALPNIQGITLWSDEDDVVYALIAITGYSGTTVSGYSVFVSYDLGFTWALKTSRALTKLNDVVGSLTARLSVLACRGSSIIPLAAATGNTDSGFEVGVYTVHFAEWSELQIPAFGPVSSVMAMIDRAWLPPQTFDTTVTPGSSSWEAGYYVLNTASSAPERWPTGAVGGAFVTAPVNGAALYWDVEPITGTGVGRRMQLSVSDGVNYYFVRCSIEGTQIRVYDWNGSTFVGSTASDGLGLNKRVQVWLTLSTSGAVNVYYRPVVSTEDLKWLKGPSGNAASAVGTAANYDIGHTGVTALKSHVYAMHVVRDDLPIYSDAAIGVLGKRLGPTPYPVTTDPLRAGVAEVNDGLLLAVADGPGVLGETLTVPVEYDYSLRSLLAIDSPSHAHPWRSSDVITVDKDIIVDVGERRIQGRSMAVLLRRSTVVSLTLAGRNGGSGSWTDIGTLDPSITYSYRTNGATLYPNAANLGLRYMRENELAGAWVDMGGVARRIASNTAGTLANGAGRQCLITISGADGTEPANGTAIIHPHTSVMVVRAAAVNDWSEWRVRINAQAVAPDAYWEVGALLVGQYQPIGMQPSHGWSHRKQPNVRQVRDGRGVVHRAQLGETQTVWTWSYQDPHDERQYLRDQDDPPWIGGEGGPADYLATYQDVSGLLWGVLERMQGGAWPCVVITQDLSDLDGAITISDPEAFLYSYLTGSIQRNNVQGDEVSDSVYRVESLTAEEVVG